MMEWVVRNILTSEMFITIAVGLIVSALIKQLKKWDKWQAWEGVAVEAVRLAETAIPDDAENKAIRKMDYALKIFITKYSEATGREIGPRDRVSLESFLASVHRALENEGLVPSRRSPAKKA